MVKVFDDKALYLGEGPIWHPELAGLIWFDIVNKQLFFKKINDKQAKVWQFKQHVSAAALVDESQILVASETELFTFNLITEDKKTVVLLESDNPHTRSNDGRADLKGGFWIGTMGKKSQPNLGAVYRYHLGRLVKLFSNFTIPNAICFAPKGNLAYLADTAKQIVYNVELDDKGFPKGKKNKFIDLTGTPKNPDGAVVDIKGNLHIAMWGSFSIETYNPKGRLISSVKLPAAHVSCPAFGGKNGERLFVTSATQDIKPNTKGFSFAGKTFILDYKNFKANFEPKVILKS